MHARRLTKRAPGNAAQECQELLDLVRLEPECAQGQQHAAHAFAVFN